MYPTPEEVIYLRQRVKDLEGEVRALKAGQRSTRHVNVPYLRLVWSSS